jgi:CHASE1-domain containing sensor protein
MTCAVPGAGAGPGDGASSSLSTDERVQMTLDGGRDDSVMNLVDAHACVVHDRPKQQQQQQEQQNQQQQQQQQQQQHSYNIIKNQLSDDNGPMMAVKKQHNVKPVVKFDRYHPGPSQSSCLSITSVPYGGHVGDGHADNNDGDGDDRNPSAEKCRLPHPPNSSSSRPGVMNHRQPNQTGSQNVPAAPKHGSNADDHGDSVDVSSTKGFDVLSKGSSSSRDNPQHRSTLILVILVVVLGCATSAAFLAIGLTGVFSDEQISFERSSLSTVATLRTKFEDYVDAASLIHARCRHYRGSRRNWDRRDFRELYEYIIETGLQFTAMQFDPNITHAERPAVEEEARQYYAEHYPKVNYRGFVGFNTPNSTTAEPRIERPWYFPIQYQEPVIGNEAALGLDYYSGESRIRAVDALFEHKKPSMTDRLSLVKKEGQVSRCGDHDGPSFGIVLMHPGIELRDTTSTGSGSNANASEVEPWPRDFSSIVLCVPDLLSRATKGEADRRFRIYIHDRSHMNDDAVFMGAAKIKGAHEHINEDDKDHSHEDDVTFLEEISLDELTDGICDGGNAILQKKESCYMQDISVANRQWTITIVNDEPRHASTVVVVVLGGVIILSAAICLAVWIWTRQRKQDQFNHLRAQAEAEKSLLILQNARQAAKTERELNDFIAHEGT